MNKRTRISLSALSAEMKRRKVYPVIAAYAVFAWVILQIGEVTFEPLGLPGWAMVSLIVLVILGFPIVFVLSWVFDLTWAGLRRDSGPETDTVNGFETPSIAVLPFVDMSPERDQEYFCDGVAEEILNALTKVQQLHVVARMSSFRYRNVGDDIQQVGADLGVEAILEGSVRKSDGRLRIAAQLIKVDNGYQIWSKSFDTELQDIFVIQDEIATSIAESLLDRLTPVKTTSSQDIVAYDYYLRGRQFLNRLRKKELEYARHMFGQAIDKDPDFAAAWAGYADCYSLAIMYEDPRPSYRDEAMAASERALELEPELAEAHASRGLAYLVSEKFDLAEAEFRRAQELNPGLFEAYYYHGRTRFHQGDMHAAAALFAKAAEVNSDDYQSRLLRVQILRGMGRTEDAVREAREGIAAVERHLEWHPDDARALLLGAGSLIATGDVDRSERWMRRALEIDPNDSVALYNVACNYATLGRVDEALGCLEQAIENGTISADWMRNDKDLENLHEHPRYEELLNSVSGNGKSGDFPERAANAGFARNNGA